MDVQEMIFRRTRRLVLPTPVQTGDGAAVARQLDAVLMTVGFKCSAQLLEMLSRLEPGYVIDQAVRVLGWAREAVGADVAHNVYFIDFPANVPDTVEHWADCLRDALAVGAQVRGGTAGLGDRAQFFVDLLSLPKYGRYQHTYAELLTHHAEFEPLLADRMTVIHLGKGLEPETAALFAELAGSAVPLAGQALEDLRALAELRIGHEIPEIRVRENAAVINAVRVRQGAAPAVKDPTDVLRLAAELSGSDVTLATPPKFTSFPRAWRRALLAALDAVPADRYPDVLVRAEQWKRLGERLHPHEAVQDSLAEGAEVAFAMARGEIPARSLAGHAEEAFRRGDVKKAAGWLSAAPGMYWRSLDRLLRAAQPGDMDLLVNYCERLAPATSARVLLGVHQHLTGRITGAGLPRVFIGKAGRAWVTPDTRPGIHHGLAWDVMGVIDREIASRLPEPGHLIVDPAILGAALPLSGKGQAEGLGVWPRGSAHKLDPGQWLRFFFHWAETSRRTDYDLSASLVTDQFQRWDLLSWTHLSGAWGEHSGDLTSAPAPHGATESINVRLEQIPAGGVVIPQLYLYNAGGSYDAGETFEELQRNFFGYMTRDGDQRGLPVEPRTVRMKTVLRGEDRVVMPVMFYRGEDGAWYAKWLHLGLKGRASFLAGYMAETNKATVGLLARAMHERIYTRVQYLVTLWQDRVKGYTELGPAWDGDWSRITGPGCSVTFLGPEQPEGLPDGARVITLANLGSLIPA